MARKLNTGAALLLAIAASSGAQARDGGSISSAFRLVETPAKVDDVIDIDPSDQRPDTRPPRPSQDDKEPGCKPRADLNGDGVLTWMDVVTYLEVYFTSAASADSIDFRPAADVNSDKHRTPEDIFMFLGYWLSGEC